VTLAGGRLAGAQGAGAPEPRRPALPAGADTNDPVGYYLAGQRLLATRPADAANAFHWAVRLDPAYAEALYGQHVALLLARPTDLLAYWRGGRVAESVEYRRIDSLALRAYSLNPLLDRRFHADLLRAIARQAMVADARKAGVSDAYLNQHDVELTSYLERSLGDAGLGVRATLRLADGLVPEARRLYTGALRRAPKSERAALRGAIARTWVRDDQPDSAIAQLGAALADLRQADAKSTVRWYEPKALWEYGIGMLHESAGREGAARAAYERAVTEDLAYVPGHARLALLALARGDTAAALAGLETAVQLRGDDAPLRYQLAVALTQARRGSEAAPHLVKAVALAPWYAPPYALLGRLYEAYDMPDEAATSYRAFLARAPQRDPEVAQVAARVAAVSPAAVPTSGRRPASPAP
jgi:hypothetical protein